MKINFKRLFILLVVVCLSLTCSFVVANAKESRHFGVNKNYFVDDGENAVKLEPLGNMDGSSFVSVEELFIVNEDGKKEALSVSDIEKFEIYTCDSDYLVDASNLLAEENDKCVFNKQNGTILFKKAGNYVLNVKHKNFENEVKVNYLVYDSETDLSSFGDLLGYVDFTKSSNVNLLNEVKTAIQSEVNDCKNNEYEISNKVLDLMFSKLYKKDQLHYTLHYITANDSSYMSKDCKGKFDFDINVTKGGEYNFYLLAKDEYGNEIKVDDLTQREDGFYNDVDELIVPIITFNVQKDTAVTVKCNDTGSKKGFIGYTYSNHINFTVENANNTEYKIYYSSVEPTEDFSELTETELWNLFTGENKKYNEAVVYDADANNDADVKISGSLGSNIAFTPLKKGYYWAVCKAGDSTMENNVICASDVVSVLTKMSEVKIEDQRFVNFVKGNWLSFIFLGIAILSFVGILCLLFIQPKETKKVAKVEEKKENKEVEVAEEVETVETVENAEAEATTEEVETATEVENAEESQEATETTEASQEQENNDKE